MAGLPGRSGMVGAYTFSLAEGILLLEAAQAVAALAIRGHSGHRERHTMMATEEYADLRHTRSLSDADAAQVAALRSLSATGTRCHWCDLAPATTIQRGQAWCRGGAEHDRIVTRHHTERHGAH